MGLKESGGFNEEAFKKWWIQQRSFQKVVDFNEEAFKKWWESMEKTTQK